MSTKQALCIDITVAAGSNDERYIPWPFAGTWRITKVEFAPATAVALNGTNYMTNTLTVNDGAAGADSSAVATWNTNTGGTAHVLKTTISPTISQVASDELKQGYQLKLAKVETGAGAALDGCLVIEAEKIN